MILLRCFEMHIMHHLREPQGLQHLDAVPKPSHPYYDLDNEYDDLDY